MRESLRFTLVLLMIASLVLGGCSSKKDMAESGEGMSGSGLDEIDLDAQRRARYGEGSIPFAEGEGVFRDVYFGFDSAVINDQARQNIDYNVQILQDNPEVRLQLEGHCDERGTAEYNLALGSRRARAVYDVLVSYGIDSRRLDTISYGEEVPLDPGQGEAAWSRNRRVHFSAFRDLPPK